MEKILSLWELLEVENEIIVGKAAGRGMIASESSRNVKAFVFVFLVASQPLSVSMWPSSAFSYFCLTGFENCNRWLLKGLSKNCLEDCLWLNTIPAWEWDCYIFPQSKEFELLMSFKKTLSIRSFHKIFLVHLIRTGRVFSLSSFLFCFLYSLLGNKWFQFAFNKKPV